MIKLSEYIKKINEEYKEFRVTDVTVLYKASSSVIKLSAPEDFTESDIQQYINDLWINKMPAGADYAVDSFGNNSENIYDVYFEYDNFEHITDKNPDSDTIEFDSSVSPRKINNDIKLDIFKLHNVRYIIKFDNFYYKNTDRETRNVLNDIFRAAESNSYNKWSINIKYDSSALKFTE